MSRIPTDVKAQAITANLRSLQAMLATAAKQSSEAYLLSQKGELNQAIGTVLGLDTILDDAKALYGAAIVLHRLKAN
jgi:hypothetical protein